MRIKLEIIETRRHFVTVIAEEGEDCFGLLDMSSKERHEQIEIIKDVSAEQHKENGAEVSTETDQSLKYWDIEE